VNLGVIPDGNIVYGVEPIRPITNLPPGVVRVRVRQRDNDVTKVFLRFDNRVEQWEIERDGEAWQLAWPIGRNETRFPLGPFLLALPWLSLSWLRRQFQQSKIAVTDAKQRPGFPSPLPHNANPTFQPALSARHSCVPMLSGSASNCR
jgi:hypothetical protein